MQDLSLKKTLGQHFLVRGDILEDIVGEITALAPAEIVEIGPGMGALTEYLYPKYPTKLWLVEKDDRFVAELPKKFPELKDKIIHTDVLAWQPETLQNQHLTIVGNFPYNISTQIIFLIIEHRECFENGVGMFQKEVAKRIASPHGTRDYGVLSVLMQAFYEVRYCFDVPSDAFNPPPKVVSGVISFQRRENPDFDFRKLKILVKSAFNQRRKTLHNATKSLQFAETQFLESVKHLRPEQLSVADFIRLSGDLK